MGEAGLSMLPESPGEIKVKGSSTAEAHPLFINQRSWDRAKDVRGRQEGAPSGRTQPNPNSKRPRLV